MRNYLKLWPYLKPHLGLLGWASACMVGSSILKGISLAMLVPILDVVVSGRSVALPGWLPAPVAAAAERFLELSPLSKLHGIIAAVVVLFILKNVLLYLQTLLMNDVAMRFLRDIREGLYRHYQRLSVDFFSGERTGELVSRVTFDVAVLHNALTEGITDVVYQTSQVVVFAGIALAIDWKLSLVAVALLPAMGYPILRIGKMLRKLGFVVQERMADMNSHLIEVFQGVRIIKSNTAEPRAAERFRRINREYYKGSIRTVKRREALGGITELIGVAGALVVLEIGGRSVLAGELTLGTFGLFLAALVSLTEPFKRMGRLHSINQQALTAAQRVAETLEIRPSVEERAGAPDLPRFRREIRYEGVEFSYGDRPVLDGVDLAVRPGEVVAIVGSSGAGKTTLVNLLLRFYDPVRGRVTLDGHDIREYSLRSLRDQIGLVTQEPFLFHDSVRANIAYARPEATEEQVTRGAQAANADGFIRRLPAGYDTPVGELGAKLSGGERQRIAIARALLKDPPILVLDEATSQLDSESEALVQEALDRLMRGRTVLVIAHRFSTIRNADRIVVLDGGRVAEAGRHEELLAGSALYRRLYELQIAP